MANFSPAHKAALDDPHAVPFQLLGKPKSIHFITAQQEESTA